MDGRSLDLYWDDVDDDLEAYQVYRADIAADPTSWDLLGEVNYPFFRDTAYNSRASHWYTVTYLNPEGEESDFATPVNYSIPDQKQWYAYVWHSNTIKKTEIAFAFTAEPVRLLFRNRTGKRCECVYEGFDGVGNCPKCYGSGFSGKGVFEFAPEGQQPMVRIYNANETIEWEPFGQMRVTTPTALAVTIPIMRPGDLIVRQQAPDARDQVYSVENTWLKEHGHNPGFITFQRMSLNEKAGREILEQYVTSDQREELGL